MISHYDPAKGKLLRETAAAAAELQAELARCVDRAHEDGNVEPAREAYNALKVPMEILETLRQELGDTGMFLAKYGFEAKSDHAVSFVLPQGVSRIEILEEAQKLVTDRDLIYPDQLERWRNDPKFTTKAEQTERFYIDGHVPKSVDKTRQEQEQYVNKEGKRLSLNVELPNLEDLAVGFVMHYLATGKSLFGEAWWVRAAGGALSFLSDGLHVSGIVDDYGNSSIAVSARALPESKNLDSSVSDSWFRRFLGPAKRG